MARRHILMNIPNINFMKFKKLATSRRPSMKPENV